MKIIIPPIDYMMLLPQVILAAAGLLIFVLGAFWQKSRTNILAVISLVSLNAALYFEITNHQLGIVTLSQMLNHDGISLLFNILFLISTAFIIAVSVPFVEREKIHGGEYFGLMLYATIGMMMMASSTDLLVIFLGLELMSIALYILASITRTDEKSAEAGMKYLLMGAFSSAFLLYGIAFIYGATGSTNLATILVTGSQNGWMLAAGIMLMIVGLGFKVGLVPFHMWIPDVYEGAPTMVTAFMSIGPKTAAFAALTRFLLVGPFIPGVAIFGIHWTMVLAGLAGLTMTLGNLVAIAQSNIKRMLAYSSIAHAGYVAVGLVTANAVSVTAVIYYLLVYFLMNLGAFAIVYFMQGPEQRGLQINQYAGLGYKKPVIAMALTIFLLSLAGFPLTGGFVGKLYLFKSAIDKGLIGLVIIALLNSVVSAYYYLRIVVFMYMQESDETIENHQVSIPFVAALIITLCAVGVLILGLYPYPVLQIIEALSRM